MTKGGGSVVTSDSYLTAGNQSSLPTGPLSTGYVRMAVVAAAVVLAFAAQASAATKPGWSLAKASAHLEFHLHLVAPDIVAGAEKRLRFQRQIGGENGILNAKEDLAIARAGMETNRASCLGLKAAPGGFVTFRCKLLLSDELGFTGKALGVWKRNPATGRWLWTSSSFTISGPRSLYP